MKGGRHAWLIAAHGNLSQLLSLLSLLDVPENDVVLHADAGWADFSEQACRDAVTRAGLFFVPRLRCPWGSSRFVDALVSLLAEAVKTEHQYYHMISGQDVPLRTQSAIRAFFDAHDGEEFVNFADPDNLEFLLRLRIYCLMQVGKPRFRGESFLRNLLSNAQKALGINRIRNCPVAFRKGAVWYSITHECAQYVLSAFPAYRKYYRMTSCADEIWLQTIIAASPYMDRLHSAGIDDTLANMVYLDWARGCGSSPYTFTLDDYDMLTKRPELLVRKIDARRDPVLFTKLVSRVRE